ncbi:MAG: hypothetical protein OXI59_23325, partial [Gemmatimonadota bacterium]|nr:hypothetical protein [Gemmatimonadota bacterium]
VRSNFQHFSVPSANCRWALDAYFIVAFHVGLFNGELYFRVFSLEAQTARNGNLQCHKDRT